MSKVQLKCDACGKNFERFPSDAKCKLHFCSRSCRTDFYKDRHLERECKQCGAKFSILRSTMEKSNSSGNFCCRRCYNEYQKTLVGPKNNHYTSIETRCFTCGKSITVTPSKMKEYEHHFCSVKCRNKFMEQYMLGNKNPTWKGKERKSYRGNFEAVKREHFCGVQFCAICGTTHRIHIHHIIPYRLTKDNSCNNLIPLCSSHHKMVESVSVRAIDAFDDYDKAKKYLNLILRGRQLDTYGMIIGILQERGASNG